MRLPEYYVPIEETGEDPELFKKCGCCGHKPRLWIFDNGVQAKCGCNGMYDMPSATGRSIISYYKEHGNTASYSHNDLIENWNNIADSRTPIFNDNSF